MPPADKYVEFSLKLFDSPEDIEEIFSSTFKKGIESAAKLRDAGIEAVVTATDIAANSGSFYSPGQIDRFVIPYLTKWAYNVKKMGLFAIMHTDGNVYTCLDELADSGIDALQALDPTAGMDMYKALKIVNGRICLCGNVDCALLEIGTEDEIYEQTKDILVKCKKTGPFILGASNAVNRDINTKRYYAMLKAWKEYGKLY